MKKDVKKLKRILKRKGFDAGQRAILLVFLSVVFLAQSEEETSAHFGVPVVMVSKAVASGQKMLTKNRKFFDVMNSVSSEFVMQKEIEKMF